MRFLCLHGMGTSAEIFETQTGPLRQALGNLNEFDFYEGECDVPPAEGIRAVFDCEDYKAWYDPSLGADTHRKSLELVREIIEEDGPFDACMGFSQGAALLGSLILSHQESHPFSPPLFRLAVFICGSSALKVSETDGTWSRVSPNELERQRKRIKIPTVHIIGSKDAAYQESMNLRDMCEPQNRLQYFHTSGHEVPRNVRITAEMARVVGKGMERALAAH
ncbi:serine hydrolase FSH [Dactylonectria macrodidyma]|uniref:Serine hydrolase FSH n=1 Tax=Dactylonectria macrodidyma TaxID=307937 RepID=A0A9P9FV18_9HYPO|nr:serine hydrolase FSH [Dactylonectria macrodidyma]